MANKKRLIDANATKTIIQKEMNKSDFQQFKDVLQCVCNILDHSDTVDAVEVVQFNALKSLVNGEWVDCKLVEEALGIDFATGLKMFDFSRTAEWNPAPLNGQKITTKFRLKNAVVHGHNLKDYDSAFECSVCGWEDWDTLTADTSKYNCCPNCGAKMDGDGNGT